MPRRAPTEDFDVLPGVKSVPEGAPLVAAVRGRRGAMTGAVLTGAGIVFSVIASLFAAVVLVQVQVKSSYPTVQEAWEHGQGTDYLVPLIATASQVLWVLFVLVGFVFLLVSLIRGYRRPWVWVAAVMGPVGLAVSCGVFCIALVASIPGS